MTIFNVLKENNAIVHVVCSGGGSVLQQYLWNEPGASAWLAGASFPYSLEETNEFLGFKPDNYCSEHTSIQLAVESYMRAFKFGGQQAVGVAVTASLASLKEHKGDHRVHACVITNDKCLVATIILAKGTGHARRHSDDKYASNLGLSLLASAFGIDAGINEIIHEISEKELLAVIMQHPVFLRTQIRESQLNIKSYALFPGAYNPPHDGHFAIASIASEIANKRVIHQVSIDSQHKPMLRPQDVLQRAKMLQGHDVVFSVSEPLFVQKAEHNPGIPIIIGADAALRMLDPKWGIEPLELLTKFEKFKTMFLVANRLIDDKMVTLKQIEQLLFDLNLNQFNTLYKSLGDQHWDISSTEIRNAYNVRSG
jgi:nicotinic acid mononucleotide adenylyltransferase/nicotinamide mononucleotide (NMN) deamidase PncC